MKLSNKLVKVAKTIVASNEMNNFPLLNMMDQIKLDLNKPQYTDGMSWEKDTQKISVKLSNGDLWVQTMTIYVYGNSGNDRQQGVWLVSDSINPVFKRRTTTQYLRTVRFALNSSGGIDGWYDPDDAEAYDDVYSEQDVQSLSDFLSTCNYTAKKLIQKLSNRL